MDFPRNEFIAQAREDGHSEEYISAILEYVSKLEENHLPVIFDTRHLAHLLHVDYYFLEELCALSSKYYKYYCIRKRTGGYRRIMVPHPRLKYIQRWVLRNILNGIQLPRYVTAYQKGSSIVNNAKIHENKKYTLKLDLKDFFESISAKKVYVFFLKLGYGKQLAYSLAKICTTTIDDDKVSQLSREQQDCFSFCTTKYEGFLPQGAPTSPALANCIASTLDKRLKSYADKHAINYSRYADDITFSADTEDFLPKVSFIRKIVEEEDFKLNMDKVGMYEINKHPKITGLLTDNKVHISCKYKRDVQRHLYFCKKYGARDHFNVFAPGIQNAQMWLLGKIRFIYQVEPEVGKKMLRAFDEINWF